MVIVGFDPSGSWFKRIVNFHNPVKNTYLNIPLVLDWVNVQTVQIYWHNAPDGGGGNVNGGIDNVLFNKTGAKNK